MDKQCDDSIICLSLVITIILTIMMAFKIVNGQNMRIVIFNNHVQSVVMVNVQNILINVYQFLEMDQSIHKKKNVTIHRMQYYFQQMSRQKKYIFNDQRETLKEIK
ncbi:unnamed protein product [Paramecium sonneborni]|uniref:Transmembrane protein n=1 Tax=Paramecium sonneborni TaxID=65129 RepID=A0A8S1R9N2_9CILI|nr:unnamed protein product [Paramecium sonneborni]